MAGKEKKKISSTDEIGGDQSAMDLDTKADEEDLEEEDGQDSLEAEEEDLEEQVNQLDIETASNDSVIKRAKLEDMLTISNSSLNEEDDDDE